MKGSLKPSFSIGLPVRILENENNSDKELEKVDKNNIQNGHFEKSKDNNNSDSSLEFCAVCPAIMTTTTTTASRSTNCMDDFSRKSEKCVSRNSCIDKSVIIDNSSNNSAPFVSSSSSFVMPRNFDFQQEQTEEEEEREDQKNHKGSRTWMSTVILDGSSEARALTDFSYPIGRRSFSQSSCSSSDSPSKSLSYEAPHQSSTIASGEKSVKINGEMARTDDGDEEFGENTEHIDYAALKGHLHVFRPDPNIKLVDTDSKGKYVFYSLQTGLLRHHVLSEIGKVQGVGVRNLSEVMRSGPFWLDICDPTVEELRALCEIFKMHPLTLEGLESEGEDIREKCDVFEKYYFVCIRAFEADIHSDDYMRPINLYMLVSPSCVVTIHRDPLEFSHTIAKRMRLLTARTGLASDWIVYTILEDVLEMFVPTIRATELETDSIDDAVGILGRTFCSHSQQELFSRIGVTRKRVTQLIRLMSAKSELLRLIAKRCGARFSDDAALYLRDLQDHTAMVDQILHHYDDSLNRSHANYLANINLEISETSNRMSDIMKKLTAISTVTLPWSMITGLMGMNIFVPGGKSYYTESWLPWLCLFFAMASSSILIYAIGRRRDWF